MMVDTRVYGYIFDGYVLCPDCVTESKQPLIDSGEAGALYSHMDDSNDGLSCDTCGNYIFEPFVEGQLADAIEDIILGTDSYYNKAGRIIDLFRENGFEMPDRFEGR